MDLSFTDEQTFLRDAVRDVCAKHCDPEAIRALEDDPVGWSQDFWQELASMDLLGLSLPAEHGGSGMGLLESVIVAEELGRAIAPSPWFPSVVVGGGLLAAMGSAEQQAQWLPAVAKGEAILTLAWLEPNNTDGPTGVQLEGKIDGDAITLSGTKIMVPFANSADRLLVLARTGTGDTDITLLMVDPTVDGIELEHTLTAGRGAEHEVRFSDVTLGADAVVGALNGGWAGFVDAMDGALIVAAGLANGGAEKVLEMTVEYAKERVQFGVPIGNFQGVSHPIADIATEIEGSKTLSYEAAWAATAQDGAGALAAMAKQYAADVFRRATRVGHQVFGGIGFTNAIDMQLYFRRAKQLELSWFEPRTLAERVAAAELDAPEPLVTIDAGV